MPLRAAPLLRLLLGTLALCAGVPSGIRAQEASVEVTARQADDPDTDPGAVLTLAYRVTNPGDRAVVLRAAVQAPDGWRVLTGVSRQDVAPGGSRPWIVSLGLPAGARAGVHPVVLRLEAEGRTVYQGRVGVRVRERPAVSIEVAAESPYLIAGDSLQVRYVVRNLGNAPGRFRVVWRSLGTLVPPEAGSDADLPAGGEFSSTTTLRADRRLRESVREHVRFRVESREGAGVADSASLPVVVVPRAGSSRGAAAVLPGEARIVAGRGGTLASYAEVSAGGRLPGPRGPEVSLLARRVEGGVAGDGTRDYYSGRVQGDSYEVLVGDQVFAAAPVWGYGEMGFGASGRVRTGTVEFSGLAVHDRWRSGEAGSARQSAGMALRLPAASRVEGSLTRLTGRDGGRAMELRASAHPWPGAAAAAGYGIGSDSTGTTSRALASSLQGEHGFASYAFRYERTGATFPGPLRGSEAASGTVSLRPTSRVEVSAYGFRQSSERVDALAVVNGRDDRAGGVTMAIARLLTVQYRRTRSEPASLVAVPGWTQQALRAESGAHLGALWVSATAERGGTTRGSEPARPWTAVALSPMLSGRGWSASGFAEYRDGRTSGELPPGRTLSAGMSTSASTARGTSLLLTGLLRRNQANGLPGESSLEATVEQRLNSGHSVALRARFYGGGYGVPGSGLSISYVVPLGLPVGRSRAPGAVTGVVRDQRSGAPIAGAVVQVGDRFAVSDRAGRVVLTGLPEGSHRIALLGEGARRLQAIAGDSTVDVTTGEAAPARFELGVGQGGRVRGTVVRYGYSEDVVLASAPALEARGGVANALVLLVADGDTVRRVTDEFGRFDAAGLRAGTWTVVLAPGFGIPDAPGASRAIQVASGSSQQIELRVLPRERRIEMVASGELSLAAPDAAPQPRPRAAAVEPTPALVEPTGMSGGREPLLRRSQPEGHTQPRSPLRIEAVSTPERRGAPYRGRPNGASLRSAGMEPLLDGLLELPRRVWRALRTLVRLVLDPGPGGPRLDDRRRYRDVRSPARRSEILALGP